jgi:hypothetical protein
LNNYDSARSTTMDLVSEPAVNQGSETGSWWLMGLPAEMINGVGVSPRVHGPSLSDFAGMHQSGWSWKIKFSPPVKMYIWLWDSQNTYHMETLAATDSSIEYADYSAGLFAHYGAAHSGGYSGAFDVCDSTAAAHANGYPHCSGWQTMSAPNFKLVHTSTNGATGTWGHEFYKMQVYHQTFAEGDVPGNEIEFKNLNGVFVGGVITRPVTCVDYLCQTSGYMKISGTDTVTNPTEELCCAPSCESYQCTTANHVKKFGVDLITIDNPSDARCCEEETCLHYTCTTNGSVKMIGSNSTSNPTESTCCEPEATCDKSPSICSGESTNTVNRGAEQLCGGNPNACHATICCEPPASCGGFVCSGESVNTVNKGADQLCSGNGDTCDAATCCEAPAHCQTTPYDCGVEAFYTVNKGSAVSCRGDASTCDSYTCCEASAACTTEPFSCANQTELPTHTVNKGSSVLCPGDISTCTAATCCEESAICHQNLTICAGNTVKVALRWDQSCHGKLEHCNSATCCEEAGPCDLYDCEQHSDMRVNKGHHVKCSGNETTCTKAQCCEAPALCNDAQALLSYSCSGDKPLYKGNWLNTDVECNGNISTCDEETCCYGCEELNVGCTVGQCDTTGCLACDEGYTMDESAKRCDVVMR